MDFGELAAYTLILVMSLAFSLADAMVLMLLWGWFIVPIFSLPALSYIAAVGVMMTVQYVCHANPSGQGDLADIDWDDLISVRIMKIVFFLIGGFVLSFFIPVIG